MKGIVAKKFDLSGKVAILTGASKGIGEAMAQAMADCGAKVVISSRNPDTVAAVAQKICDSGGEAIGIPAHVGKQADLEKLVNQTIEHFGRIDILVNNAAANPVYGPVQNTEPEAFDKIMEINVKGPYLLSRLVLPHMEKQNSGSIINISSIGGVSPEPGIGIYSVSKASLISLTKVMANEWGPAGIRVNAVCPGLIKTKFSQAIWDDEKTLKYFTKQVPLGRMGMPDDLSGMAVFLASDASAYCTGSIFMIDGGLTI